MTVDPGRLFFVGDPKQSIYRFRRADIATFLAAQDRFADPAPLFLTCNFRTAPAVLAWINHVFAELIQAFPASQPEYRPLDAARNVPAEHDRGVVLLGVDAHDDDGIDAAGLRVREAADVAAIARRGRGGVAGLRQGDQTSGARPASATSASCCRRARRSATSSRRSPRRACRTGPRRARSSTAAARVRDLLMTLRAIDDSSNTLALVSALRSSVFGCGDDDLFTYHVEHGGRWNVAAPYPRRMSTHFPPTIPSPRRCASSASCTPRVWSTPSELLERIVRERGRSSRSAR